MNPYGINIGEIPNRYIKNVQLKPIADAFENGSMKDCIFYGPSGCGKTVAMTMIRKKWVNAFFCVMELLPGLRPDPPSPGAGRQVLLPSAIQG